MARPTLLTPEVQRKLVVLVAAGFPKAVVDTYIRGAQAGQAEATIQQQKVAAIMDSVGGEQAYKTMASWAKANLTTHELDAYNRIVDSGQPEAIQWAINGLKAKYTKANGTEPSLLGGAPGQGDGTVFRSSAEVVAAMRDPRYNKDVAYTEDVIAKLSRSNVLKRG